MPGEERRRFVAQLVVSNPTTASADVILRRYEERYERESTDEACRVRRYAEVAMVAVGLLAQRIRDDVVNLSSNKETAVANMQAIWSQLEEYVFRDGH